MTTHGYSAAEAAASGQAQSEHLLLRVEYNTAQPVDVRTVFLYSHGFPDASVATDALISVSRQETAASSQEFSVACDSWNLL